LQPAGAARIRRPAAGPGPGGSGRSGIQKIGS